MDREGQTWCHTKGGVVFTVVKTHKPMPGREYHLHEVVYLEHPRLPGVIGARFNLEEALDLPFTEFLSQLA